VATRASSPKCPRPPQSCAKSCVGHARLKFWSFPATDFLEKKRSQQTYTQGTVPRSSARCTKSCHDFFWFPMTCYDCHWFPMIPYDFLWCPMISDDFLRVPLISYSLHRFPLISNDSSWSLMIYYDFLWFPMISLGFLWFPMIPHDFRCFPMIVEYTLATSNSSLHICVLHSYNEFQACKKDCSCTLSSSNSTAPVICYPLRPSPTVPARFTTTRTPRLPTALPYHGPAVLQYVLFLSSIMIYNDFSWFPMISYGFPWFLLIS